jgi:hypothetical protein
MASAIRRDNRGGWRVGRAGARGFGSPTAGAGGEVGGFVTASVQIVLKPIPSSGAAQVPKLSRRYGYARDDGRGYADTIPCLY